MSIRFLNRGGEKIADYMLNTVSTSNSDAKKLIKAIPALTISGTTSLQSFFSGCSNLVEAPEIDMSNITNVGNMFFACTNLKTVPQYNLVNVTAHANMFLGCSQLTSESLNNILASLTTATEVSTKTLNMTGLTQAQAQTCVTLSNYAAFKAAGWKTGYTAIDDAPEYTKLEYIQGIGAQYLDTGITPKATQRIEMEVQLDAVTAYERLFGVTDNGAVTRGNVFGDHGSDNFFVVKFAEYFEYDNVPVKITMLLNTKYKLSVDYATKEVKLDDVSLGHVTEALAYDTRTIQVFSGADSDVAPSKMKLYSFKIYEGDELVLDLIPVKRNSDNVVCAYDTVSETYFTNEGTGVFTAGAEVEA